MSTIEHANRILARKIADAIMTNGCRETADRVALKLKNSDGFERDLGGWGRGPLLDKIAEVLNEEWRTK